MAVIQGLYKYTEQSHPSRVAGLWNLELDAVEATNLANRQPETRLPLALELKTYRNSDHSGIHFWVQGGGKAKEVARGTLRTTGRFERVRDPGLEADDRLEIQPDDQLLSFELHLDGNAARADRDGIVFDVFPIGSPIVLEQFGVDERSVPVLLGREASPAGDLPATIDRESAVMAIDHPDELFARSGSQATGATAHIGFVSRSQGKLSDLADPIVERLKALGYVE